MSESILYIVATPIGNLGDMTLRAIDVLKQVDVIAAEDTRHSKRLLNHFGIDTRLVSCHEHNERQQTEKLLARLSRGDSIALISDAGTPLISDPGYYLVRSAREARVRVMPVPGVCALIAALSVSGLATDRFYFEGFLPAKSLGRKKKLSGLSELTSTWGFYESSHRIRDCLDDCLVTLGESRYIVLVREITKVYETVIAGSAKEVQVRLHNDADQCRGEFVVLVEGDKAKCESASAITMDAKKLMVRLLQDLPIKKACAVVADITGERKKKLYDFAVALKENS